MLRIPASGLQAAETLLAVHTHNIANVNTDGFVAQRAQLRPVEPRGGVEVGSIEDAEPDFVEDVVGLLTARTMYGANAKVFSILAETEQSLLDVRA